MNSLPPMENVARLSSRVIRILGQNGPSKFVLQGTNTYLIGTGRERILLDTGEGVPEYDGFLRDTLIKEDCTIRQILLSHWHHDHVEGLPAVQTLIRNLYPDQIEAKVSKYPHDTDEQGWSEIRDQEELRVEGATLRAIHTPGHTTDHLSFLLLEDGVLFTADHILGGSTSVFEDLGVYMSSLRKVQKLNPAILYPGHGHVIENGAKLIGEYIAHREAREEQVIRTLQDLKTATAMELVKVIYKDVREDLHFAAEHGVKQHLDKLRRERRVVQVEGESWKMSNPARI